MYYIGICDGDAVFIKYGIMNTSSIMECRRRYEGIINIGRIRDKRDTGFFVEWMNDLLKCGILDKNINVYDMHKGMNFEELRQYDMVYICGGETYYLLERMNETGFHKALMEYIHADGVVLGVSAGRLIFLSGRKDNDSVYGKCNRKEAVHEAFCGELSKKAAGGVSAESGKSVDFHFVEC